MRECVRFSAAIRLRLRRWSGAFRCEATHNRAGGQATAERTSKQASKQDGLVGRQSTRPIRRVCVRYGGLFREESRIPYQDHRCSRLLLHRSWVKARRTRVGMVHPPRCRLGDQRIGGIGVDTRASASCCAASGAHHDEQRGAYDCDHAKGDGHAAPSSHLLDSAGNGCGEQGA